ncbi:Hsp20/alpha crystallin family protein [Marinimicrobium alkaliphilum]|uniref:Hsp20/alpha crystallin family protein n=1 Tax=Marinimicrobium alkaliphilum TaxID=2202654 RepID=UPI000DBA7ABD|nr:Hsp20/alpha crystallin family protein [Marinimicrobium alkaliphilum]
MKLEKLKPWNWLKHEDEGAASSAPVPVKRGETDVANTSAPTGGGHPIWQLHREIDRLFDSAFRDFGFPSLSHQLDDFPGWGGQHFRPNLDVSSDDKTYRIAIEAPGLKREDISLELRGDALVVSGSKREESEDKDRHYYRVERRYGSFQRVLSLPEDAKAEAIEAQMRDGILEITIPRTEVAPESVKRIDIKAA